MPHIVQKGGDQEALGSMRSNHRGKSSVAGQLLQVAYGHAEDPKAVLKP